MCKRNFEVTGFIAWSKSSLFVSNKTRFHIEALIVDTKYRYMGIASRLMKFLEDIARTNSPSLIDLTSGKHREKDGTHQFYNKHNYKNEGLVAKLYLRNLRKEL